MSSANFVRVTEIISQHLGVKPSDVRGNLDLRHDLGADSLDLVELLMALEDEFNITFDDKQYTSLTTVGTLLSLLSEQGVDFRKEKPEPMTNAYYRSKNPIERQISNLAYSQFVFQGRLCNSFEGFYQGIKGSGEDMQNHVFLMSGMEAKKKSKPSKHVYFNGKKMIAGSEEHHELLFEVQKAKYSQHQPSREALLATGESKITHKVGRDSEVYPARVFCRHLTQIRSLLQKGEL